MLFLLLARHSEKLTNEKCHIEEQYKSTPICLLFALRTEFFISTLNSFTWLPFKPRPPLIFVFLPERENLRNNLYLLRYQLEHNVQAAISGTMLTTWQQAAEL